MFMEMYITFIHTLPYTYNELPLLPKATVKLPTFVGVFYCALFMLIHHYHNTTISVITKLLQPSDPEN